MNKIYIYFFEPFVSLSKRIYITLLTVLFLTAFFFFVSAYSNAVNKEDLTISLRNNETFLSYRQMYIYEPALNMISGQERMYEGLNRIRSESGNEEVKLIQKETDRFFCDLYEMQNDYFVLEQCSFRTLSLKDAPAFIDGGVVQADESFFAHEYLPIFKGRSITEEDFNEIRNAKSSRMIINVIAGYSYSEYYDIGDILNQGEEEYTEPFDENESDYSLGLYDQDYASFRIVGFIEKGVTFSNFSGSIHKTDNMIFVPHIPEISIYFPEIAEGGYNSTYCLSDWKILIGNGKTEEYCDIINQKLNGLFIDRYCDLLDAYGSAYEILDEVVAARNDSFIFIAIILLIFSVSGIVVSTVNKFKGNVRSYAIHQTIGATDFDIYLFATIEMLIQILIANAVVHIPFILCNVDLPVIHFLNRNIPYFRSPIMYLLILLFSVFFIIITVVVTAYCMKKYSIAEILKGKE